MAAKNILIFCGFILLSYIFFGLAQNNGFWHGDDFVSIQHSLMMLQGDADAFTSQPPFKFQPATYLLYFVLFKAFLFNAKGYFVFNILLHGLNSFLVYSLVQTVLKDRTIALLSGLLFAFTVGSYGKSIMIVSGLEDLLSSHVERNERGAFLTIPVDMQNRIIEAVANQIEIASPNSGGQTPAVLCSPAVRVWVRRLIENVLPQVPVLGYNEIVRGIEIQSLGMVVLADEVANVSG